VQKQVGSASAAVYIFSGTIVIAEYAAGAGVGSPTREYIYSGGPLLSTTTGGTTTYQHADYLSVRVSTDTTGTVLRDAQGNDIGEQGHYPFGELWYAGSGATKWKFTSYERDTESSMDYATARFYINRFGRFYSPDPVAGAPSNPQTLNLFTYVVDDPIDYADPDGTLPIAIDGGCHGDPGGTPPFFPGGGFPWPVWWPGGGGMVRPTPTFFPTSGVGGGEGERSLGLPVVEVKVEKENCYGGVQIDLSCTYGCTGENNHFLFGFWVTNIGDVRRKCPGGWEGLACPIRIDKETTLYCIYGICVGKTIKYTRCS